MMLKLLLLLTTLLAAMPACAESPMAAALRRHIAVLASDDFAGRQPGTAGETKTIAYIAREMQAAGLKPGAKDGGWYQRVELVERTPVATRLSITRGAARPRTPGNEVLLTGREAGVRLAGAPIIYAGFGRPADLDGVDLTGALVIYRGELPGGAKAPTSAERRAAMLARGAAGLIGVLDSAPWTRIAGSLKEGLTARVGEPTPPLRGSASPAAAKAILIAAGAKPALYASAMAAGFKAVRLPGTALAEATTTVRRYPSYNVIGLLPGRDADGEAVAFTAHWDHLGLCRPEGAPDRICNGAVDNASGVAMLLETARGLAKVTPAKLTKGRDLLFVATTAEELGLLGAEAFASDPPRPLGRIVAAINIDTDAIGPAGLPAAIIGRGTTPGLDAVVDEVAATLGRKVDTDVEANVMATRQDGWALGRRGLPSVMVGGSFSDMQVLEGYLDGNYHKPSDDLAHLPSLEGAAEDVALQVAVGAALADRGRYKGR